MIKKYEEHLVKTLLSQSELKDLLSDFASFADELEKEGAFLDNPHDHPTDRAGGKAYKESAARIREIIEKAKGR